MNTDKLHKQSDAYAQKYGIEGSGYNDAVDAFRHAYSSAVLARDWGVFVAESAGITWELMGLISGDADEPEARMDAYNNYVGRTIQQGLGPDVTNDKLAEEVHR